MVQFSGPGIVYIAYVPAWMGFPPIRMASSNEIFVEALAPVLHISLNGTNWPNTTLPLAEGREYSRAISVRPNSWLILVIGLNILSCMFNETHAHRQLYKSPAVMY